MSTEQILREPAHVNEETQTHVASNKVDINILMEKVRAEKKKGKKRKFNFL